MYIYIRNISVLISDLSYFVHLRTKSIEFIINPLNHSLINVDR